MPEVRPPVRRIAGLFAFACVFALASCSLEMVAHALGARGVPVLLDPWVIRAGSILRLPLALLGGLVLGLPFGIGVARGSLPERAVLLPALLSAAVLVASSVAWFELGRVGALPRIAALSGLVGASMPAVLAALVLASLVPIAVVRVLPFAERRFAKEGAVAADAIIVVLASTITIGAIMAGTAPIMYGAVPPLVQAVVGLTPSVDPVPEPGNGHHHGAHDHSGHAGRAEEPEAPTFVADPAPTDGIPRPGPEVRYLMSKAQSIEALPVAVDPSYPFCRTAGEPSVAATTKSVLLVVLEGVGQRELFARDASGPRMPALTQLADEGVSFEHVLATSDDPSQGLVSILSGVTAQPVGLFGDMPTLPTLPSLPITLREMGRESALFSGRDLARGLTSRYLRQIGVSRIEDASAAALLSAGHDDTAAVTRFMAHVDAARAEQKPVFATLVLGRASASTSTDAAAIGTTLRAVDADLGTLAAWFREKERARGTVLVVTSSSASQVSPPRDPRTTPLSRGRFEVPLVVVGEGILPARTAEIGPRVAATYDVPQTVLGALGRGPTSCFMGRDLLAEGEWPSDRLVVSTGGASQRNHYVHWGPNRWQTSTARPPYDWQVVDLVADEGLTRNLVGTLGVTHQDMMSFHAAFLAVSDYLVRRDRYAIARPSTAQVGLTAAPRSVALSVTGMPGSLVPGAARTYWVPITTGADGTFFVPDSAPVRTLANIIEDARGARVVLEVVGARDPLRALRLVDALAGVPASLEIVIASTDVELVESIGARTERPVWTAFPDSVAANEAVAGTQQLGANGVVFPAAIVDAALIERAHGSGLAVIARDVPGDWDTAHADVRADAVVTADVELAKQLARARASARP